MTPPNTPTPRTNAEKIHDIIRHAFRLGFDADTCDQIDYFDGFDAVNEIMQEDDYAPINSCGGSCPAASMNRNDLNKALSEGVTLERELAEAKDVLRSIRDHEVNPEDYADQYLRDHQHSELHKAINDRDQLRAVNKELRSYLDAAHYATCNEELRAKLTQIKAEIAQIYQEREHNANQALIYKAERDELRAELIEARNHEYAGELKAADQELAQLREVAGELAVACHNVISPLRPHWRETMQLAVNALAKYDNLTKGTKE